MTLRKLRNVFCYIINLLKMRRSFILFIIIVVFQSCQNDRIVQLPSIQNANITNVIDVSPAYIFYDESLPDSMELNRKNLIGTTNWLVNIDKRLTLRQVIPKVIFLQNKKRTAQMHKNENARNYYTCNDTIIKNLGFIDFTDIYYETGSKELKDTEVSKSWSLLCYKDSSFQLLYPQNGFKLNIEPSTIGNSIKIITHILQRENSEELKLYFQDSMTFQHYISLKNTLQQLEKTTQNISNTEYLFH